MRVLLWVFGLMNAANGLWMLADPEAWYHDVPAGVPDTGPLNLHFVRDIGSAFLTIGTGLCVVAERAAWRRPVIAGTAMFLVLHALVHVVDLATGRLDADHWLIDLPGVFLPAIVFVILLLPRWYEHAPRGG